MSVVVRSRGSGFAQEIVVREHRLTADEPMEAGGTDAGPNPYELLLAALGSCTSMTIELYARRKNWPLEGVVVRLAHTKIYAVDCAECDSKVGILDRIDCELELHGPLGEEQKSRLLEISEKCPIHRTLTSEINIRSRLV